MVQSRRFVFMLLDPYSFILISSLHQRSLYNAWITTLKLRESVRARRTELQHMRQTLKLASILKGHVRLFSLHSTYVFYEFMGSFY